MDGTVDLQKTIMHGLPESSLREIAEYIFFVRQKALAPSRFREQFEEAMMVEELSLLESQEVGHLEDEFKDYQDLYPKE